MMSIFIAYVYEFIVNMILIFFFWSRTYLSGFRISTKLFGKTIWAALVVIGGLAD